MVSFPFIFYYWCRMMIPPNFSCFTFHVIHSYSWHLKHHVNPNCRHNPKLSVRDYLEDRHGDPVEGLVAASGRVSVDAPFLRLSVMEDSETWENRKPTPRLRRDSGYECMWSLTVCSYVLIVPLVSWWSLGVRKALLLGSYAGLISTIEMG